MGWRQLGAGHVDPPPGDSRAAAVLIAPHDGFADPPALAVRDDVLAAVGPPERVRAGGLADLVLRLRAAGHEVHAVDAPAPRRPATPARLHREGSGRFWLFRRWPREFPLPRPAATLRFAILAVGALRANGCGGAVDSGASRVSSS